MEFKFDSKSSIRAPHAAIPVLGGLASQNTDDVMSMFYRFGEFSHGLVILRQSVFECCATSGLFGNETCDPMALSDDYVVPGLIAKSQDAAMIYFQQIVWLKFRQLIIAASASLAPVL